MVDHQGADCCLYSGKCPHSSETKNYDKFLNYALIRDYYVDDLFTFFLETASEKGLG